ncbi:MAG: ClpXP protease specificity-enhancing factor SspB [Proteobacteria bacterium]|nr:ClpXP protease specificity-enhancing factor SspB [Pseudomonadota bacterium]
MEDLIGYDQIIESSMRNVIHETLKKVEKNGLPGNHHFVISFATNHPDVVMPEHLKKKFTEEMTIIIQHQFNSLITSKDSFEITLNFSGNANKLVIPYRAITSFADPSINFGLKFNHYDSIEEMEEDLAQEEAKSKKGKNVKGVDLSAKVVSLDAFRKDKDKNDDK